MTDNKEKKKPLIIESSDDSQSSIESEKSIKSPLASSSSSSSSSSSKVTSTSTVVPSTSTDVPSSTKESNEMNIDDTSLEADFSKIDCSNENLYSNPCNKFLLKRELLEEQFLEKNPDTDPYLYPSLSDKNFNIKIASKKEFNDTKYDGTIHENIKEQADILAKADFELQPHQAFVKNFLSFQTPYSSLLLYHGLGTGKCMKKGTPIMLSNGKIELIENIKVGDLLMGDDSKPRTVLSLARGYDKMYDIIPIKGEKYTVNQEHILCLRASGFPKLSRNNHKSNTNFNVQWIENNEFKSKTFTFNQLKNNEEQMKIEADSFFEKIINNKNTNDNIIEIAVKDYIQLSEKKKGFLKGYKVPVEFPEKELPIDPYIIGYWLGDGHSNHTTITSQDSTVVYYFAQNIRKYNLDFTYTSNYHYSITGKRNENSFLNILKNLNMLNNKHIPMVYKCNSRENRLKLLAGLLDSDGHLNKEGNGFEFTQKNEKLMDDVIYLARSLGFACYKCDKKTSWTYKGEKNYGNAWRIHINGSGLEEIPTLIPRKKASIRKQIKDVLVTGIEVKYVNEDDFYGFTLDGNCRYLMGDFTVTHNTCSAIGVCEEMRDYMKQMGITKRIIIVASENVQDNFKLQLFDERKLKLIDGVWNIRACTGNKLLKEINPMNMRGIPREKVVSQIKNLINSYYIFLGYGQFANYIIKTMNYSDEVQLEKQKFKKGEKTDNKQTGNKTKIQMFKDVKVTLNNRIIRRLRNEFDNRLIVIDEVHNIRKTEDNEKKTVAINLEYLVKAAQNMRFLLLSATPMYNSYKEIIWLLNLMNTNDRRSRVDVKDIFDKNGNFKKNGEEVLVRKATGYISYVRGENPYTFPFRVYPNEFAKEHTFPFISYPEYQMNLKKIPHQDKKRILSLYLNTIGNCNHCGKCQYCVYKYIIYNLRNKKFSITTKTGVVRDMPSFENMESFGYTLLQIPLESLIISYPMKGLKEILDEIPKESFSEELSQSFSESTPLEDEEGEEEKEKLIMSVKQPKSLIIESSTDVATPALSKTLTETEVATPSPAKVPTITETQVETPIQAKVPTITETQVETPAISKTLTETQVETPAISKTLTETQVETPAISKTLTETQVATPSPAKVPTLTETEIDTAPPAKVATETLTKGGANSFPSRKEEFVSIDPHQLTGKAGLERMMNFIDEKSPPQKGDFEYKKSTLENYGKIFSRELVGKYSSKIKTVLDNILNPETDKVDKGVILVYSQYIDSGLIPMALALEEMGFTRYGQNVKPLFKNKPNEIVDVKTMKPPVDKKNFMPARYSMITGDPRFSPNNDFEVKGLTNEDNKDGNKVKVVLISKAGSEGIDLKFIRQVHILDPWYNMNRIEQIIGRAVRNFSHKDLPFEQRNVEIFMYGTILGDNKEESADLYVYRVAEYKAIQIGNVSRILKESAVDCIINHDQTNFTQEIISANLKESVTQELSNGMVLQNFKVGDAPFSPACDYMATCNYSCRPDKKIDESKLNEDTYNENFIIMNSEKILQRIRMLMKESYFYKKDMLLKAIRTPKEYPYVQIYSALTQLIEDENEIITDKYERNGRLINIGEYYLFQPLELLDKNVSIFDRSVPIDYKHSMINFEIKQDVTKPVIDKRNISQIVIDEEEIINSKGLTIVDEMKENYDITKDFTKLSKVPRGDDNWYKHCGIVIKKMSKEFPESSKYLIDFLVAHMIELLLYQDKVDVMNYIYSLDNIKNGTFEWFAKEYFEKLTIVTKNLKAMLMFNLNKRVIMILDNKNKWVVAEPEDEREIATSKDAKEILTFKVEEYNKIIGFIGYEKSNRYLVFKTKDMLSKRDTGARCDESGKDKTIKKLNEIIGENKYTNETTKMKKDEQGNIISEAIGHVELCVLEEFILRFFDTINKNNKKWFLTPELAIYFKIYTINI
jgi:hypothetical protein